MSFHHENVIWQSPDGTWNRGFYSRDYLSCGGSDDCDEAPEHEWCQEFDMGSFEWVSTGHRSQEDAHRSWDGANPGSSTIVAFDPARADETESYEDMAARRYERAREQAAEHRGRQGGLYSSGTFTSIGSPGYWGYSGPPKYRSLVSIKRERDAYVEGWAGTHAAGYANMRQVDQEKRLDDQIAERLKTASPEEVEAYERADAEHRERLREGLEKRREARRESNRRNSRYSFGISQSDLVRSRALTEREDEIEAFIADADAAAAKRIEARTPEEKSPAPAKKTAAKPGPQSRQPKGIPSGGQFAASARAESEVSLPTSPPTTADSTSGSVEWGDDPWG